MMGPHVQSKLDSAPGQDSQGPFGNPTVRANMHPGYENPDAVGPCGPVIPALTVVSVQSPAGLPIALLAQLFPALLRLPLAFGRLLRPFRRTHRQALVRLNQIPPLLGLCRRGPAVISCGWTTARQNAKSAMTPTLAKLLNELSPRTRELITTIGCH